MSKKIPQMGKNIEIHGESKTRLYNIWHGLISRCERLTDKAYTYYGGRGIKVCTEWRNSYIAFKKWAYTHGYNCAMTIDRIDNDLGYWPGNCQWITQIENTRKTQRRGNTP